MSPNQMYDRDEATDNQDVVVVVAMSFDNRGELVSPSTSCVRFGLDDFSDCKCLAANSRTHFWLITLFHSSLYDKLVDLQGM